MNNHKLNVLFSVVFVVITTLTGTLVGFYDYLDGAVALQIIADGLSGMTVGLAATLFIWIIFYQI